VRILLLNYEFPPVGGGGGVATLALARQWARDHEVDCVTSRVGRLPVREVVEGIRVFRVPVMGRAGMDAAPMLSLLCYPVSGLIAAQRLTRRRRYDVINSHFAVPTGPLGMALSAAWRIPHVVSIHGGDIYDPSKRFSPHRWWLLRRAVRSVLKMADAVVAQSTDTAARAAEFCGDDLGPAMKVIPLPFDPPVALLDAAARQQARAGLGLEQDAFYLVSVGRLVRRKAYDRLILALEHLPDSVRLVIVGGGPLANELRSLAAAHGLAERVRLAGRISERDKYRYLKASDLYVLSSWHEGFGIVLQEAMAAGLPIVSTSHGGQTDVLKAGVNALLVENNEPQILARAVRELLQDEAARNAMAEANSQEVARFASEAIAGLYLDVFREAVSRCGRPRPSMETTPDDA
jgi:glycosyltransferase involved in cell wall biosynthesis